MKVQKQIMTKYILHGGRTGIKSEDNRKFFREILKDLKTPIKVLLIYFAREENEWPKLFEEDKDNFLDAGGNRKINIVIASKNINELKQQIKQANVVHIRGGETQKLQNVMKNLDLKSLFNSKVVVGSSAGSYILSKYYYNNDSKVIREGLNILQIKTFCHYTEDQQNILEELKNYKEDLKIYTLPEQKFIVIKE